MNLFRLLQVAWSVARITDQDDPVNPLSYPVVLVNEGDHWNQSTHTVTIPVSGYYFIHLSAGVLPSDDLTLDLLDFNMIHRDYRVHDGVDTIGRSVIRQYTAGTLVSVSLVEGGVYSDDRMQTTFIGLLLYTI